MRREVVLTGDLDQVARGHLLRHYQHNEIQEDICFGLWYPSQGRCRLSAVIHKIILPVDREVHLHGNASFEGRYVTRAIREARKHGAGLVIMHSHPSPGWQDVSGPDICAERDEVAYPAQATGKPLVGMTIGDDGYWSARFWFKEDNKMVGVWCRKVRVPARNRYKIYWKPSSLKRLAEDNFLLRTIETWGVGTQKNIQNLRIGIVGLGSVGALVAETLARIGVSEITLIDADDIKAHNLDRLLYGKKARVGESKVVRARKEIEENSTAPSVTVRAVELGIEHESAYLEALDCDLIVSCVDRPVARDVLNYIAMGHLIPVVEGGVAVDVSLETQSFNSARWRSHIVVPGFACIRCTGQYNSSAVVAELDGSLDDPSYIMNLPPDDRPQNQNVFPFSLGSASMQTNLMIRYLIGKDWWPGVQRQEYKFIGGRTRTSEQECSQHCSFRPRVAVGNQARPSYLKPSPQEQQATGWARRFMFNFGRILSMFSLSGREERTDPESAAERI